MTGSFTVDAMPGASVPSIVLPRAEADSNGCEAGKWHVLSGTSSESGVAVTPATALSHGPVWACVNRLAGDIGQLPWHKMIRRGRSRDKDRTHALERILTVAPNPYQTPAIWKETMMAWALLWGNGISYVHRVGGRVDSLWPLQPDRTGYIKEDGQYWIWSWVEGETWWFHPDDLFHIRGLTHNGFWGESFVKVCRDVIGHGLALRKHGNATFKNGARPSVAVNVKKPLSFEARKQFRKEWMELHGGVENAGAPVILFDETTLTPYSTSNIDSQWLDAVKLDPVQVAILADVPPHMVGALENSAVRANLEDQTRGYFQRSLGRHCNKFNEQARRVLLTDREIDSADPHHYFRWIVEAFLRGDTKTRFEAYSKAISARIFCPNEVREMEDMDPYDGGDEFANPAIDKVAGGEKEDPESDEDREEAVRNLVRSQCKALCEFEANKLVWGAKNAKAWMDWVCDFYAPEGTLATRAEQLLAGVCDLAAMFQLGSGGEWQEQLKFYQVGALSWAMTCERDDLAAGVDGLKNTIVGRAAELAGNILGGNGNAG